MTEKDSNSGDDKSRRSFVRDGALASGGLALGLSSAGTVAAQQNGTGNTSDGGTTGDGGTGEGAMGLIFAGNFHPGARFAVVSDVVEWIPNYGTVREVPFSEYNTYMIRWQNTGNVVPLWVAKDADIGHYDGNLGYIADNQEKRQPQLFEMDRAYAPSGDDSKLVSVNFAPVPEDEGDRASASDDWWRGTGSETDDGLG